MPSCEYGERPSGSAIATWVCNSHRYPVATSSNSWIVGPPLGARSINTADSRPERTTHTLAKLPPLPPAGRAPQGGHNAAGGNPNPKDARAGSKFSGNLKQGGVGKAAQSSRKQGDR